MKLLNLLILLLLLSGCTSARYNTNFADIHTGMAKADVVKLLGKPLGAEGQGSVQVLHYRLASSILDSDGSDTREYWVRLVDDKVAAYGERNDATSRWRSQQQYEAAWNSLGAMGSAIRHGQETSMRQQEINAYRERTHTPARVRVDANIRQDVNGTIYLR